jgi:hypothetical protein
MLCCSLLLSAAPLQLDWLVGGCGAAPTNISQRYVSGVLRLTQNTCCAALCCCSWTGLWEAVESLPLEQQYVLMCLPVIGQRHILMMPPAGETLSSSR